MMNNKKRNNKKRRDNIKNIINKHYEKEDQRSSVVDILADTLHFCKHFDINFKDVLRMATDHFEVETKEEQGETF